MSADHTSRAALTALAQQPSLTAVPFTLAGLAGRATWQAHTLAGELVCDAGEYVMARKNRQRGRGAAKRAFHSWPSFLARYYTRETWRGVPGPWPVKVILTAAAIAEPGPFGEIALAAFGKWNGGRKARKAAQS